jgi:hypothetical protein
MASKGNKRFPRKAIKKEITEPSVRANHKEIKILSLVSPELRGHSNVYKLRPYVALKYFKSDWQCFSDWASKELKEFSSFLSSLQSHTWEQVYKTGSKIPKHGLAYTKYEVSDIKSQSIRQKLESVKNEISEEINFFELRVNQNKLRVHGFQSQSVFFLVALDRNHEAFPM